MSSTTAEQADRAPVRMSDREIAPREVLLTTSDDWFLLGKAIRDVFEHDRRRYGDRLAFDRIRELLARNPHVTSASVDQPYVHLMMAGRPEYVVYLNTTDVTRGEYLARTH